MKRLIFLIICLFISILKLNSINDTYRTNMYGSSYTTYEYIPFKSTSPSLQNTNYNTVKPLNADGSVSMEYTTYKAIYSPRRANSGLELDDNDEPNATLLPVGDPDIFTITFLLILYLGCQYLKNRKSQMLLLNIQKQ